MRRALTWLAGAVGLAALMRVLSRRHATVSATPADPAEELRRKLADQRRDDPTAPMEADVVPESDPAPDAQPGPGELEERRARVHARAQEAIELMSDGEPAVDPDGDTTE